MTLQQYERYKFRLAEIIRYASAIDYEHEKGSEQRWRELSARLADDRFNVVVVGRFNRGKSTLMNALLGMDRLPTGIIPLTSVITTVRYGTSERVLLEFEGSALRGEASLGDLAEYVTEKGNPGNKRHIRSAEIQLPAEILRRGFFFVDTPGLGSAIFENTETTERYIPEIDVLVLVSGYESPLTEEEVRFLSSASAYARGIFVVLNKHDTVPPQLRADVLQYAKKAIDDVLGGGSRNVFSLSARDGLIAKQTRDHEALRASGLQEFEEQLLEYLTTNRSLLVLDAICDRIATELRASGHPELTDAAEEVVGLKGELRSDAGVAHEIPSTIPLSTPAPAQRNRFCEICGGVLKEVIEFLRHYQYELSTRPEVQRNHAKLGGFCPLHTWHYEQISSPHGVCTSYPRLLMRFAEILRSTADQETMVEKLNNLLTALDCPACQVRRAAEDKAVQTLTARWIKFGAHDQAVRSAICLPHLRLLVSRSASESFARYLVEMEADLLERTAEDMQRYAVRHDGLRRALTSAEERRAYVYGLQLLVGHRAVNAYPVVRDII